MQILQKHSNLALSFNTQTSQSHSKASDISLHITRHFIALQREEIQLHPQNTDTSFPNQEILKSHPSNPTPREETPQ